MARAHDHEIVSIYPFTDEEVDQLATHAQECVLMWSTKDGWPVGVIMSYVYRDGKFWLTASSQRARISAVRRDPRVCVVVTSTGSKMSRNKTVTYKGMCTVRDDQETKDWFYPALAAVIQPDDPARQAVFAKFLDSPRRVILEVQPTQRIGYDGGKMGKATAEWMAQQQASGTT